MQHNEILTKISVQKNKMKEAQELSSVPSASMSMGPVGAPLYVGYWNRVWKRCSSLAMFDLNFASNASK